MLVVVMYVSPYCGVVCGFLLLVFNCALVTSLKADVVDSGGNFYICALDDTPCISSNVVITYQAYAFKAPNEGYGNQSTWYYAGGQVVQQTINVNTLAGSSQTIQLNGQWYWLFWDYPDNIWNATDFQAQGPLVYTIAPGGGDNALYQTVRQATLGGAVFPTTIPPSVGYAAKLPNPCNPSSTVDNDAWQQGVTNYSSSPAYIPQTGQLLQPGQGTSVPMSVPQNYSGTTNISVQTLNPNTGMWQNDGLGINLTNNVAYNGGFTNWQNQGQQYANQVGALSDSLITNSGGPIIWQASTLSNGTAVNAAGFSDLANNQLQQDQLLSNLLSGPLKVVLTGTSNNIGGSSSNVWVQNWPNGFGTNGGTGGGTNFSAGGSNVWVQNFPWTNDPTASVTNALLGEYQWATNNANQVVSPWSGPSGPAAGIEGGIPSTFQDDQGGDNLGIITVGNPGSPVGTLNIALITLPSGMMAWYSQLRALVAWCLIVGSLLWNTKFALGCFKDTLNAKGVSGVDLGIWDSLGAKAIVAFAVAALVLAAIVTVPQILVGMLTGEISFLGTYNGVSHFMANGGSALQWVDQIFPIWILVTICGFEVVFFYATQFICITLKLFIKLMPGA